MSKLRDFFNISTDPIQDIKPGLYTSHDLKHGDKAYRLHLRVEPNQEGLLTLNASTVLHLNKTAMEMAYFIIQGKKMGQITNTIANRYKASKKEIKIDVHRFYETLMSFVEMEDLAPTGVMGTISKIEDVEIVAPYRLDCYLTSPDNGMRLSMAEWKVVLEKAFNAGIPHIMFVDFTTQDAVNLLGLLRHVEELGLVSGVVAKPELFRGEKFLGELLNCGLDHLVLEADPLNSYHRNCLLNILDQDLFTCLRMPYQQGKDYEVTFTELFEHGLNAFSYKKTPLHFDENLIRFEQMLSDHHVTIIDDMPYSLKESSDFYNDPRDAKSVLKYLKVLSNGDLCIPSQEPFIAGNLLNETWEILWAKCREFCDG